MKTIAYNTVHPPGYYLWERTEGKMRVDERARRSVVFIGIINDQNNFIPYGTGFVISVFTDDVWFDYIVTCHHIIESIDKDDRIWVRVNLKEGGSEVITIMKSYWIINSKEDIAITPYYLAQNKYDISRGVDPVFATREKLRELQVAPGEPTFTVGLFTSHFGTTHNMPIVRVGNMAAIPKDPIWTNTGYVKAYLIESRSIGGLSGSPVFVQIAAYRTIEGEYKQSTGLFTHYLLGMMRGHYETQFDQDVVRADMRKQKDDFSINDEPVNAGIGIVIPIDEIMCEINMPEQISLREKHVAKLKEGSQIKLDTAILVTDNPQHKEDFMSLVSAAAKKKPQDDKT